ncbi:MAG: 30S ribosomal protein S8 [Candidatus Pacearchaeota archaeon]
MSQDIVSDALNQIMNAKKAKKSEVILKKHSLLLKNILDIAKQSGYLDYRINGRELTVEIKDLNEIRAIKPRFTVHVKSINGYVRRFLPAKNFGLVILSTNKGIMVHTEAEEKNIGGCLIAYMF